MYGLHVTPSEAEQSYSCSPESGCNLKFTYYNMDFSYTVQPYVYPIRDP